MYLFNQQVQHCGHAAEESDRVHAAGPLRQHVCLERQPYQVRLAMTATLKPVLHSAANLFPGCDVHNGYRCFLRLPASFIARLHDLCRQRVTGRCGMCWATIGGWCRSSTVSSSSARWRSLASRSQLRSSHAAAATLPALATKSGASITRSVCAHVCRTTRSAL